VSAVLAEKVMNIAAGARRWPTEGLIRVPYWVYSAPDLFVQEQEQIFRGPTWSFLCLEAELPGPNTYRRSNLGTMPVVVTRDGDGKINAFENRCAHRGSLLCLHERGAAKDITCVYHNWSYDLAGNLTGVAFRRGLGGKGGMPADAKSDAHAPRKLRVETLGGLVFGTLSSATPPLADYLGVEFVTRIERVMRAPVKVLGHFSQVLPSNWKLYIENVKDSYHASLLHAFFTTFRLNRLSQKGGILVSESGGHHVSYSLAADTGGREYEQAGMRAAHENYGLEAPQVLASVDEFGDGIGLQILSVFPGFILQQTRNSLAVRRIVPVGVEKSELVWTCFGFTTDDNAMTERRLLQANLIGPSGYISMEDGAAPGFVQRAVNPAPEELSVVEMGGSSTESADNRVTEASVRGFWKAYRQHMGL
jgi:anthranilate 1,2-dioxygenase large subunit/terephthalate 1,2-dioxygenase oxygenase component alpha subunit